MENINRSEQIASHDTSDKIEARKAGVLLLSILTREAQSKTKLFPSEGETKNLKTLVWKIVIYQSATSVFQ